MEKINITSNKEIAPEIYSITFRKNFNFIPGQMVKVTTSNSIAPRMYSIASATSDKEIQLVYDIKPEGELTNILKKLRAGDEIYVSEPFGQFICNENNAWLIATGTGIAPFYSMLKSENKTGIRLLHGVRRPENMLFKEEFLSMIKDNYIPCCSGKKIEGVFYGRVTEYLFHLDSISGNLKYYLCGSAEMVVDVRDILINKGVAYNNIFSEIYF